LIEVGEAIETPSGKSAKDENFPVGSWLLPAHLRPHIAAFYAFARAADDIADNESLDADDKVARLDAFAQALEHGGEPAKAAALRTSLAVTGVPARHGLDLLAAFRQDARKARYRDWGELMDYCALSAAPVGRYLLDLHGESPGLWPAVDALCAALQVLNHLQDCQDDYRTLDRVYLPQAWLTEGGGGEADLTRDRATAAVRACIDRCLDGTDALLAMAAPFPARLKNRRLAMESAVVLALARRLAARLRRGDPVAGRVALSRGDFLICGLAGMLRGLFPCRCDAAAGAAA
jgi:squalene synthase HpnC